MTTGRAEIGRSSKDSINIRWQFSESSTPTTSDHRTSTNDIRLFSSSPHSRSKSIVRGYRIRYQAIGSSVVQYSQLLDPSTIEYDITNLHEDTNYDVCVVRVDEYQSTAHSGVGAQSPLVPGGQAPTPTLVAGSGPTALMAVACVKGTTSTASLSVSLGSTIGAFMTIGFVVALVFAAKWHYAHRLAKKIIASSSSECETGCRTGFEMIECNDTIRQPTEGGWRLRGAVADDRRLSGDFDYLPSSTLSAASRCSSSVSGSEEFDQPPLCLALYAVSEAYPEYGVLAGILSEEDTVSYTEYNGVGHWISEVGATCSERGDRRTVGDATGARNGREELAISVDYDEIMLSNNECTQQMGDGHYEFDEDDHNDDVSPKYCDD